MELLVVSTLHSFILILSKHIRPLITDFFQIVFVLKSVRMANFDLFYDN